MNIFEYIYKGFIITVEAETKAEADKEFWRIVRGEEE